MYVEQHLHNARSIHTVQFSQNTPVVAQTTLPNSHRTFDALNGTF